MDTRTLSSGEPTPIQVPITEAYEAFATELRRYATARMRDPAAAEDIVQEAFVRLAVESHAWRGPSNPRAWLYRVVRNLIISRSRRAEVARRRSSQLAFDEMDDESPETTFLSSERNRALGAALQAVGADGRTGLILAAQGYSSRDIAEVLGRSEGATRTLICRTRRHVRRELTTMDAAPAAS